MSRSLYPYLLLLICSFCNQANAHSFCHSDEECYASAPKETGSSIAIKKSIQLDQPLAVEETQIPEWINKVLGMERNTAFILGTSFTDKLGFTHRKYYQTYKGHRVQDGVFIVHSKDQKIHSANGEIYRDIDFNPNISIL